jgi:hypothetical protein
MNNAEWLVENDQEAATAGLTCTAGMCAECAVRKYKGSDLCHKWMRKEHIERETDHCGGAKWMDLQARRQKLMDEGRWES